MRERIPRPHAAARQKRPAFADTHDLDRLTFDRGLEGQPVKRGRAQFFVFERVVTVAVTEDLVLGRLLVRLNKPIPNNKNRAADQSHRHRHADQNDRSEADDLTLAALAFRHSLFSFLW